MKKKKKRSSDSILNRKILNSALLNRLFECSHSIRDLDYFMEFTKNSVKKFLKF